MTSADSDFDPDLIGFRPLTRGDLPQMHRWINQDPEVHQWYWPDAGPYEQLVVKYEPRLSGDTSTRSYIITYRSHSIGHIQDYLIDDHPGWARVVGAEERAAGVDMFIGEPEYRGGGRGTAILRKFVRQIVFARSDVESCVIGPDAENARAIRCYEKAGFRFYKTEIEPETGRSDYLMRLSRRAVFATGR